jgi:hypothetical protein
LAARVVSATTAAAAKRGEGVASDAASGPHGATRSRDGAESTASPGYTLPRRRTQLQIRIPAKPRQSMPPRSRARRGGWTCLRDRTRERTLLHRARYRDNE